MTTINELTKTLRKDLDISCATCPYLQDGQCCCEEECTVRFTKQLLDNNPDFPGELYKRCHIVDGIHGKYYDYDDVDKCVRKYIIDTRKTAN